MQLRKKVKSVSNSNGVNFNGFDDDGQLLEAFAFQTPTE